MDLDTVRLRLEPCHDSHYEGFRIMENHSGVMRYIRKGLHRDPPLETVSPNRQAGFSR